MTTGAVLSIQSRVAFGHVGNSAATLPLQRLGLEVIAVDTVQLAHHPGHGSWHGHVVEVARLAAILHGLDQLGVLGRLDAVLSGYLGDAAVGDLVVDTVGRVKRACPDALYALDPVIGDDGPGVFVRPGIPELFRDRLVPLADVVMPNRFELAWLAGAEVEGIDQARAAAAGLLARGPRLVVVTGLPGPRDAAHRQGSDQASVAVLAVAPDRAWLVTTPRLKLALGGGSGDLFAALFVGHLLRLGEVPAALERAVAATFAVVERTLAEAAPELALVAAQDALVAPERRFVAQLLDA